ncbi:hypothetical protein C8J56DRAFT_884254 [Mycena floridula]|nr:hypothetical protein C8J56DRAFT_884254 [Mycena floridula]
MPQVFPDEKKIPVEEYEPGVEVNAKGFTLATHEELPLPVPYTKKVKVVTLERQKIEGGIVNYKGEGSHKVITLRLLTSFIGFTMIYIDQTTLNLYIIIVQICAQGLPDVSTLQIAVTHLKGLLPMTSASEDLKIPIGLLHMITINDLQKIISLLISMPPLFDGSWHPHHNLNFNPPNVQSLNPSDERSKEELPVRKKFGSSGKEEA